MYTQGYSTYNIGNITVYVGGRRTTFAAQQFSYNAANYRPYENPVKQKHPEAVITKTDLPDI